MCPGSDPNWREHNACDAWDFDKLIGILIGLTLPHDASDAEIDNNVIENFPCMGVLAGADGAWIHHNRIVGTNARGHGYGVSVYRAEILAEFNRIDHVRHAVAGGGLPDIDTTAYEARYNVVGSHFSNHIWDMHSDDDGDAGKWLKIHHNTDLGGRRYDDLSGYFVHQIASDMRSE